jgi:hypothetical protein
MAASRGRRASRIATLLAVVAAGFGLGFGESTVRYVAWSAVDFFPADFARQVRRNHRRYDAGIQRGLNAPPAWRAGPPGQLGEALTSHVMYCAEALRRPIPLEDLVEEVGVLAVLTLDANDPLAVAHNDPREPEYSGAYEAYVSSVRGRVRLVYYGQDRALLEHRSLTQTVDHAFARSRELYPFVGAEFYRTGVLRNWRQLDDRSVAFGVAAVSLSRGLTDLANFTAFIWQRGGGQVPTPVPTPEGHVGETVTLVPALEGGFPARDRERNGTPMMPPSEIRLPPP